MLLERYGKLTMWKSKSSRLSYSLVDLVQQGVELLKAEKHNSLTVFACKFLCIPLPDSPFSLTTKNFINNDCRISQICPKSGNTGVHFDVKFEAAVKILAPNRKCIFKSPVRGCRGWIHPISQSMRLCKFKAVEILKVPDRITLKYS